MGPKSPVRSRLNYNSTYSGVKKPPVNWIYFRPFIGAPVHSIDNSRRGQPCMSRVITQFKTSMNPSNQKNNCIHRAEWIATTLGFWGFFGVLHSGVKLKRSSIRNGKYIIPNRSPYRSPNIIAWNQQSHFRKVSELLTFLHSLVFQNPPTKYLLRRCERNPKRLSQEVFGGPNIHSGGIWKTRDLIIF